MKRALAIAVLGLVAGCGDGIFDVPHESGSLRLETAVSRPAIQVGDTATMTHRLTNTGSARVDLVFGSSCVVMPYITGADTDQVVYPGGGGWACAAVITPVSIEPGEAVVSTVIVRGGAPQLAIYTGVPLGHGSYLAFSTVEFEGTSLRSVPVRLAVR